MNTISGIARLSYHRSDCLQVVRIFSYFTFFLFICYVIIFCLKRRAAKCGQNSSKLTKALITE